MSMQQAPRHRASSGAHDPSRPRLGTARENRALIAAAGTVFFAALVLALATLPGHRPSPASPTPDYLAAAGNGASSPDSAGPSTATLAPPSSVTRNSRETPIKVGGLPQLTRRATPTRSARSTPPPTRKPTTGAPHPSRTTPASSSSAASTPTPAAPLPDPGQVAQSVFEAVNAARRDAGLRPLRWNWHLQSSAHGHNLAMAQANTLSHQLPGEDDLGRRESTAGVSWYWAGENIAETSSMTTQGALDMESAMLNEQPPNDGHRSNILSRDADALGVDVVLDSAHQTLWLTEDFAQTSLF